VSPPPLPPGAKVYNLKVPLKIFFFFFANLFLAGSVGYSHFDDVGGVDDDSQKFHGNVTPKITGRQQLWTVHEVKNFFIFFFTFLFLDLGNETGSD
jgi:hypothetical protein